MQSVIDIPPPVHIQINLRVTLTFAMKKNQQWRIFVPTPGIISVFLKHW